MPSFVPSDLPSFAGRTVIVTGANSGLGLVTAREFARVGARVILACRNADKGDTAAATMTGDVQVRRLDLQNLASVREFADSIGQVDVLINNAGIMAVPYAITADGFESQIGTNHLGHFALTNLLLPKLADRVVAELFNLVKRLDFGHQHMRAVAFAVRARDHHTEIRRPSLQIDGLILPLPTSPVKKRRPSRFKP